MLRCLGPHLTRFIVHSHTKMTSERVLSGGKRSKMNSDNRLEAASWDQTSIWRGVGNGVGVKEGRRR